MKLTGGMNDVPLPGLTVGEVRRSIEHTLEEHAVPGGHGRRPASFSMLADVAANALCVLAQRAADARFDFAPDRSLRHRMEVAAGVAPKRMTPNLIKAAEQAASALESPYRTSPQRLGAAADLRIALVEARRST